MSHPLPPRVHHPMPMPVEQAAAGHVPAEQYAAALAQLGAGGGQPVIIVQPPAPPRQYGPLLLAAVVGGGIVVAALLAAAVVAIAVAVCVISLVVGWLTVRALLPVAADAQRGGEK